MDRIYAFNQTDYLSDVMRVDGWETALENGSCYAITIAFASFVFQSRDHNLEIFFDWLDDHKAKIAEDQTNAVLTSSPLLNGYELLLREYGLTWAGDFYNMDHFTQNFGPGTFALCLVKFDNNTKGHALGIVALPDANNNLIYTFDPNFGLLSSNPQVWYNNDFRGFINQFYSPVDSVAFRNITLR